MKSTVDDKIIGYNMEGFSYEERLRCLNLWTLEERRNRQDLIEVFKISQGKSIIGFEDLFVFCLLYTSDAADE